MVKLQSTLTVSIMRFVVIAGTWLIIRCIQEQSIELELQPLLCPIPIKVTTDHAVTVYTIKCYALYVVQYLNMHNTYMCLLKLHCKLY